MSSLPAWPRRSLLLALAGAGLQACTAARPAPAPHRSERFELVSADGQRRYRVQLVLPHAAPPAGGHPLLVMLDGNAAFAALTDEVLARQAASGRPLAIATLGHESPQGLDVAARAFDYTPPVPGENPTWDDASRQRTGGGADLFLDLVAQQVLPEVHRRVRCDPARSTLWGHSYGGLLALYALFTRPALFARYAAADPSLWWHDGFMLSVQDRARPLPADRRTQLLLMAGGAGTATRSQRPGMDDTAFNRRAMLSDATPRLAERLALRAGLDLTFQTFPGVGHGAMRPASIPPTLAFAAA
ncbi:alpha/beta hydrolase [Pseudorhodoferax sp. Leaf274]|uniref:alpha/beta hydrolase n=1 Tax=Pseudorhodoferax sp. Leaf274 TaxID=1736318 RepID=UPI00138F1794|nr:alpha/beta hydrolase-fold protein [Pseudorhodoferax sp. Leaf274]